MRLPSRVVTAGCCRAGPNLAVATGCRTVAYSREGFGRSSPRKVPITPPFVHEEALDMIPRLRAG